MISKNFKLKYYLALSIIFVIVNAWALVKNIAPKKMSFFLNIHNDTIVSCYIGKSGYDSIILNGNQLEALLSGFENYDSYYKGRYDNILLGTLCHMSFISDTNNSYDIIVSDENILYIDNNKYEIRGGPTLISEVLNSFY